MQISPATRGIDPTHYTTGDVADYSEDLGTTDAGNGNSGTPLE